MTTKTQTNRVWRDRAGTVGNLRPDRWEWTVYHLAPRPPHKQKSATLATSACQVFMLGSKQCPTDTKERQEKKRKKPEMKESISRTSTLAKKGLQWNSNAPPTWLARLALDFVLDGFFFAFLLCQLPFATAEQGACPGSLKSGYQCFCVRSNVLAVARSSNYLKQKTRILRERDSLLAVWPRFSWHSIVPMAYFLDVPKRERERPSKYPLWPRFPALSTRAGANTPAGERNEKKPSV